MQTFLPYPSFAESAACLDSKRLGKQRVEALQIWNIVSGKRTTGGWINHPAVSMWRGHPDALALYTNIMITEWIKRGYNNTMELVKPIQLPEFTLPSWLGNADLHASHRSNLLRKDSEFYSQYNWSEPNDLPYVWSVK
jgi:hypothetical protein